MRILKAELQNFGSYRSLSFDYSNLGLSLVSGPTGAGKSTLVDAPCWILFGITSKDGAADDVISWDAEEPTIGTLTIALNSNTLTVTRVRGNGKNDLYWNYAGDEDRYRGKDLIDSQHFLEGLLGVTAEQYLLSSYFHQFSKMDSFFFAKAKERRELLESICDLEFPQSLGLSAQNAKKEAKKIVDQADRKHTTVAVRLEGAEAKLLEVQVKHAQFEAKKHSEVVTKRKQISDLESKLFIENPPQRKLDLQKAMAEAQIGKRQAERDLAAALAKDCPTCKRPFEHSEENIKSLEWKLSSYRLQLADLTANALQLDEQAGIYNKISLLRTDIASLRTENPFSMYLSSAEGEVNGWRLEMDKAEWSFKNCEYKLFLLEKVYDLSTDLRTHLLQSTVSGLEKDTNRYLESHFDSAIRASFTLVDSDKVQVNLYNDGFECSYKQLSGGQRRMVTLAFALSVMQRTANKAGFHPSLLVFDEALNGLDADLKTKAFTLFQALSKNHESILLMDHSEEMKELFDSKILVSKTGSESHVSHE